MDNFTGFFKDTEILQKAAFNKKNFTKGSMLKIVKTIFVKHAVVLIRLSKPTNSYSRPYFVDYLAF